MAAKKRKKRKPQNNLLVLRLLILVVIVLAIFEGRLIVTMFTHRSSSGDTARVETEENLTEASQTKDDSGRKLPRQRPQKILPVPWRTLPWRDSPPGSMEMEKAAR